MAPHPRAILAAVLVGVAACLDTTHWPTVWAVLTGLAAGAVVGYLFHEGNVDTDRFVRGLFGYRRPVSTSSARGAATTRASSPTTRGRAGSPYRRRRQSNPWPMYGAALVAAAAAYYFQLLPGVGALLYDIGFLALALLVCSVASFALTLQQLGWTYASFRAALLQGTRHPAAAQRANSPAKPPQRLASSGRGPARAAGAGSRPVPRPVSVGRPASAKAASKVSDGSRTLSSRPEWDGRTKGPSRPVYRSAPPPPRRPPPPPPGHDAPTSYAAAPPQRGPPGQTSRPPAPGRNPAGPSYSMPPTVQPRYPARPAPAARTYEVPHRDWGYAPFDEEDERPPYDSRRLGSHRPPSPRYFHSHSRDPSEAGQGDGDYYQPRHEDAAYSRPSGDTFPEVYPNRRYAPVPRPAPRRPLGHTDADPAVARHRLSGRLEEAFPASVQSTPRPANPIIGVDPADEYPPPRRPPRPAPPAAAAPQDEARGAAPPAATSRPREEEFAAPSRPAGEVDGPFEPELDEEEELEALQEQIATVHRKLASVRRR